MSTDSPRRARPRIPAAPDPLGAARALAGVIREAAPTIERATSRPKFASPTPFTVTG